MTSHRTRHTHVLLSLSHPLHFFFLIIPPPPRSTLFPYTTLFRSRNKLLSDVRKDQALNRARAAQPPIKTNHIVAAFYAPWQETGLRSEEHTSELQSRQYLVCRLLLEKKKKKKNITKQSNT